MTVTYDEMPIEIAMQNIHTAQCEFTRGFWLGHAVASAAHHLRDGFGFRLPTFYADDVQTVLPGHKVTVSEQTTNQFGVEFATIWVSPR